MYTGIKSTKQQRAKAGSKENTAQTRVSAQAVVKALVNGENHERGKNVYRTPRPARPKRFSARNVTAHSDSLTATNRYAYNGNANTLATSVATQTPFETPPYPRQRRLHQLDALTTHNCVHSRERGLWSLLTSQHNHYIIPSPPCPLLLRRKQPPLKQRYPI